MQEADLAEPKVLPTADVVEEIVHEDNEWGRYPIRDFM